jgi:hypothetical protein
MKLTDDNLDFADCRPGPSTYPKAHFDAITPDYIKVAIREAAKHKCAAEEKLP